MLFEMIPLRPGDGPAVAAFMREHWGGERDAVAAARRIKPAIAVVRDELELPLGGAA